MKSRVKARLLPSGLPGVSRAPGKAIPFYKCDEGVTDYSGRMLARKYHKIAPMRSQHDGLGNANRCR